MSRYVSLLHVSAYSSRERPPFSRFNPFQSPSLVPCLKFPAAGGRSLLRVSQSFTKGLTHLQRQIKTAVADCMTISKESHVIL